MYNFGVVLFRFLGEKKLFPPSIILRHPCSHLFHQRKNGHFQDFSRICPIYAPMDPRVDLLCLPDKSDTSWGIRKGTLVNILSVQSQVQFLALSESMVALVLPCYQSRIIQHILNIITEYLRSGSQMPSSCILFQNIQAQGPLLLAPHIGLIEIYYLQRLPRPISLYRQCSPEREMVQIVSLVTVYSISSWALVLHRRSPSLPKR